ncbi:RING-H2 finger protein ATL57-like [Juglans regia]|uniref:RING-type E3 ubiquitin transferase n=1 Tax=Juglans regia TaxID=51240 RepID=A0A2I4FN24_JUGRE|nr:RING-H2 finger protein ATL57-like [Juglans regia]
MKLHGRKLLLTQSLFSPQPITSTPTPPPWSPASGTLQSPSRTYTFLESPVVLVVLPVILLALCLFGCISKYCMHQLPDDESHPRRREPGQEAATSSLSPGSDSNLRKGIDLKTIGALPVYSYGGNSDDKCYEITDCAICLSEFQQKEAVKTIPFCKHVFHPGCIDTWLSSHVTCPVCRST